MTHFGLICPALSGHLNTMLPLGQELQRRGHRVTLFGILDAHAKTMAAGLDFQKTRSHSNRADDSRGDRFG